MDHAGPLTALASTTDFDCIASCARGWPPCPLRSEKRQRGQTTGLTQTRTSRRASSLGSLTDHAGPSTALASTMDLGCFTSCARGWPPCLIQRGKRHRGQSTGLTQTRTSRRASSLGSHPHRAGPSTAVASTMDLSCFIRAGLLACYESKKGNALKPRA